MFLSIYTPTYNRCNLLKRCYESLCEEDKNKFEWIVIDDGSTDNTRLQVEEWIEIGKLNIVYVYKKNEGVHSARNLACEIAKGELCMCIDSDDYIATGAVQKIYDYYQENNSKSIVGIIALNETKDKKIVGELFPKNLTTSSLYNLYKIKGIKGDKKLIYRTNLLNKYKYPVYKGEKGIPPSYVYYQMDQEGDLLLLNETVCIVEYQLDGISNNIERDRFRSPKGMVDYYELMFKLSRNFKEKYLNTIRIQSYRKLSGEKWKSILFSEFSFIKVLSVPGCLYFIMKNKRGK
ncbi:glycosyltransferase family A protein [Marinilactibacillus psychrotolerans]|uniref:Glycosyl transferase n=1 Tax=Marinilactibacillus psychrotolerans TaxID=191770 RepID=A0AAV3WQK3_9LACT|nr:glycosyltransferase family A protein [Marinilactibacillus psychrotolerans]GEL67588.1 sugar transferase [Marinilactibacillus psychrotolerans]GEQ35526.1 glycosyl transferase [Marinilactibacillus psychrotolerans]SDD08390.1 Glycosyl transferase family 2 [Marinilactibacillus psychrotolerans]